MAEVVSLAPRIKSVPWSLATRFTEPVSLKSNSREISSKGERSRPAVVRCSFYGTGRAGPWSKSSRENSIKRGLMKLLRSSDTWSFR